MNDHEAERIAAAINAARPDWPTTSVLTLIRKKLLNRPRRDVFVALAWVAADADSKTPARVVEQGPWWKAAGVETAGTSNDRGPRCAFCGQPEDYCRRVFNSDHVFEGPDDWMRRRLPDPSKAVAEARAGIAASKHTATTTDETGDAA